MQRMRVHQGFGRDGAGIFDVLAASAWSSGTTSPWSRTPPPLSAMKQRTLPTPSTGRPMPTPSSLPKSCSRSFPADPTLRQIQEALPSSTQIAEDRRLASRMLGSPSGGATRTPDAGRASARRRHMSTTTMPHRVIEPHRFVRWVTLLPSRREIVLLLCAAVVEIDLRGRQEQTLDVRWRNR